MHWNISKIIQTFVFRNVLTLAATLFAITGIANPADVRVLVDVSGSMKNADPNAVRGPATALLAAMLPDQSKGGIWLFGSDVRPLVPYGPVDARWDALARPIEASIGSTDRFTHMESALRTGIQAGGEISSDSCHIILITDGIVDIQGGKKASQASRDRILEAVLPNAIDKACRIHTIALSDNADLPLLRQMAIQTNGLFTRLDRPGDLIPVMLDALELALRSQQLPVQDQSIRVDSNIRQIRLIRLNSDEMIQLKSTQIVIDKNSSVDGVDYYSGNGYQTLIWSDPIPDRYKLIQLANTSDRVLIDSDVRLEIAELPPTIGSDQTLGLNATLTGLQGPIEDVLRQFKVSFGQGVDPRRFKGSILNSQIDSPPVGRSILTVQSFDNRYERQVQRAFEVLSIQPALEIATNSSKGIGEVSPSIAGEAQSTEPNSIKKAFSNITDGIKELASKVLGNSTSIETRKVIPQISSDQSSQNSSKDSEGKNGSLKTETKNIIASADPNYAENSENWPLWQLIVSALGAIALVALMIGLILRPKNLVSK